MSSQRSVSGVSARRLSRFFWAHRFHPLLLPAMLLFGVGLHGGLHALAIVAQGGSLGEVVVGRRFMERGLTGIGFYFCPAAAQNDVVVMLAPIGFWVVLVAIAARVTPGLGTGPLARIAALFLCVLPGGIISGSLARATIRYPLGNFYDSLHDYPVVVAMIATLVPMALGRAAATACRRIWGTMLSPVEFAAGYAIFIALPWIDQIVRKAVDAGQ